MSPDEAIRQATGMLLSSARGHGWTLPWHLMTVGVNGTMRYERFTDSGNGSLAREMLTEHQESGGLRFPVNLVMVDVMGAADRVVLFPPNLN